MRRIVTIGLAAILICLVACTPYLLGDRPSEPVTATPSTVAPVSPVPDESASPPAELIEKLKSYLTAEFGIPKSAIAVQTAEPEQWADACLGIPQPDELCAQMITPGYRISLSTPQGSYEFHTDRTGEAFRLARSPQ